MRNEWYSDCTDDRNDVYRIRYGKVAGGNWVVSTARHDGETWDTITTEAIESERIYRVALETARGEFELMGFNLLAKKPHNVSY